MAAIDPSSSDSAADATADAIASIHLSSSTPELITAVQLGEKRVVAKLLAARADPNTTDGSGDTPLHAVRAPPIARLLIDQQANPNKQNNLGSTPLHKAVMTDNYTLVSMLLESRADPLLANASGFLPEQMTSNSRLKMLLYGDSVQRLPIHVPQEKLGALIGKKGQNVRELEQETGATIKIPPRQSSDPVTIIGRPSGVQRAKAMIEELLDVSPKMMDWNPIDEDESEQQSCCIRLPLPKDQHKLIAVSKTRRALEDEFGVRVMVPSAADTDCIVQIRGEQDNIDQALKKIYEIVNSARQQPPSRGEGGRGRGNGSNGLSRGGRGGDSGRGGRREGGAREGGNGSGRRGGEGSGARGGARGGSRSGGRGGSESGSRSRDSSKETGSTSSSTTTTTTTASAE